MQPSWSASLAVDTYDNSVIQIIELAWAYNMFFLTVNHWKFHVYNFLTVTNCGPERKIYLKSRNFN